MRTMLRVSFPVEKGNQAIKDGSLPKTVEAFMTRYKPEAAYFFPEGGKRSALFVFDLADPSHIPAVAEHFFFALNAEVRMTPVMNVQDLQAGLKLAMS